MNNFDLYLSDIATTLKDLEINGTDVDGIESEINELTSSIQNFNDDFNEKMDKLIEVLSHEER